MSETYESILSRMQGRFQELAGFQADDASDIGIRLKVLAGEIFSAYTNLDWLQRQVFPQTAQGSQLDYHAQQRGIQRKSAVCSQGMLEFSREAALLYDVTIPEGTVCATSQEGGQRFLTTRKGILKAGDFSVSVPAASEEGGAGANAAAGTVKVLVTPPPGVTAVTNRGAFTGGADGETDQELRERILESYRNIPNGTNSAFYREFALQYDGVYSASVSPRARGAGTVDVYVASKGDVPGSDLITRIQNDLNAVKEINVDVQVQGAQKVSVDIILYLVPKAGYDYSELKPLAEQALRDYMAGLSIGESVYMTKATAVVYGVEGVEKAWPEPLLCHDVAIQENQLAVAGTIGTSPQTEENG